MSTRGEDQQFLFPTTGENVLNIVLSSHNELVDNVKTHEPLGNSDHNLMHLYFKINSENKNKKYRLE